MSQYVLGKPGYRRALDGCIGHFFFFFFWVGHAINRLCLGILMMMPTAATDSSASGKGKAKAEKDSIFQPYKFLESNVPFYLKG